MMPNVLQYMVAIAAVLRAGYVVVNVNPLYTPRELEHQLKDSGAEAIVVLENFATTLEEVIEKTDVRHVVLASMGDLLGILKGPLVNFVVRHVRKMVPEFRLPIGRRPHASRASTTALAEGARMTLQRVDDRARRRRLPAVHRRHDRRIEGRDAAASQRRRQHPADRGVVQADARQARRQAAHRRVRVAAVSHLRADDLLHDGRTPGHDEPADPEPARHSGLHQDAGRAPVNMFPAVNTLFNALANEPDFAQLDFSGLVVSNGGGMAVQQATAEKWLKITGCPIVEGYGLSETSPVATSNRLDLTRVHRHASACRFRRPRSRSATTTATTCRSASRARSASAARR